MEKNVIKRSLERYKNTSKDAKDIMSTQILDTIDAHLFQVIDAWMDEFQEESSSKVYKKLYEIRNNTSFFE